MKYLKYIFGSILFYLLIPYWIYKAKTEWKKNSLFMLNQYKMLLTGKLE